MDKKKKTSSLSDLEVYPQVKIAHIKNPSKLWAFPVLGGLVKVIILTPVFIEIAFLAVFDILLILINSFVVLLNGKYWEPCYTFNLGLMRLLSKVIFYFSGLTDNYPGFDFQTKGFTVDIEMPKNPSRLWAFPIFGGLARILFLIPFAIYSTVINNAARVGTVISSVPVFFSGKYPEGTYELTVDATRLSFAQIAYAIGLKDNYPSFNISMKHKTLKIVLIIIGILMTISQYSGRTDNKYDWDELKEKNNSAPYNQTDPRTFPDYR